MGPASARHSPKPPLATNLALGGLGRRYGRWRHAFAKRGLDAPSEAKRANWGARPHHAVNSLRESLYDSGCTCVLATTLTLGGLGRRYRGWLQAFAERRLHAPREAKRAN